MPYARGVVERAMTIQEVILRAIAGQLTWLQAADILGRSPRSIRRLRWTLEHEGYEGLFDRRQQTPSPKRAPVAEVQRVLALYRDRYQGFNVRHFHQLACREHGVGFCHAFVKKALQMAGLVPTHQPRGRHRRRREPRPCYGELLHLDGSRHRWLALTPDRWSTLLAGVDDATKQLLYAELHDGGESVAAIMTALRTVLERDGLPLALYTDRAHWAVHPPTSGSAPDRRHPPQVGRALARLGIEHILGYSPQARGRSERVNRTLQDRLVNELRVAGITTVAAANRYLRDQFLPAFNTELGRTPAEATPAFVPLGRVDLDQILCVEADRVVGRDNVVTADGVPLQVASSPGAAPAPVCASSCAATSTAIIRSGMAPVVSGGTTSTGVYCGPPDGRGCSPERSNHGVKQLRSDHVSTTAEYAIAPIARLANGHDLARSGRYWKSIGPTKTQLTALPFSAPRPSAPSSCPASYRKAPPRPRGQGSHEGLLAVTNLLQSADQNLSASGPEINSGVCLRNRQRCNASAGNRMARVW